MIGHHPAAAFNNSTGERRMLEYTGAGGGLRLTRLRGTAGCGKHEGRRERIFGFDGAPLRMFRRSDLYVRFGSLADITARPRHVRSPPQSRHSSARAAGPLSANSRHPG